MPKKTRFLDELTLLPWWVSASLAIFSYVGLSVVLPNVPVQSPLFKALSAGLSPMAAYVAGLFILTALLSLVNAHRKRKLLNTRTDLDSIKALTWSQFEELTGEYFRQRGYQVIENCCVGADGGVDIRLRKDGELILVQCKNWRKNKVGVSTVRELLGAVTAFGASRGIVVCSGPFTEDAKKLAASTVIDIVDGGALIEHIRILKKSAPTTPALQKPVPCPRCQNPMVIRKASKGKNAGKQFLGCSTFPKCRSTLSI